MTFEKFDWRRTMQQAAAWRALSPAARERVLAANPIIKIEGLAEKDVKTLRDGRLLFTGKPIDDDRRLNVEAQWVGFAGTLRRANPFATGSGVLYYYVQNWYEHQHLVDLSRNGGYYGAAYQHVASSVNSRQWVEGFLEAKSLGEWLKKKDAKRRPLAAMSEAFGDAQTLLRASLSWKAPAPFEELEKHAGDLGFERALRAFTVCVHYFTLFLGVRGDGAVAIDLLPNVGRRLRAAPAARPESVVVAESFECPFALDDAIALVAFASRQNIRLKQNDGQMFAADEKAIAGDMIEAPTWLFADPRAGAAARLRAARARATGLKLLKESTVRGKADELRAAPKIADWMSQPRDDRLREMLEAAKVREEVSWTSLPAGTSQHTLEMRVEFRDLMRTALRELPTESFWGLNDFVVWRATIAAASPKLVDWMRGQQASWYGERITIDWLEERFSTALVKFIFGEMLPLGAVCVGLRPSDESESEGGGENFDDDDDDFDEDGEYRGYYEREDFIVYDSPALAGSNALDLSRRAALAIRLTPAGEYMLGLRDDFQEAAAAIPAGAQIVVQPNFEIAFLGRAPSQEARVSRYAERTGRGVGVLFRLTKASIVGYAASGGSVDALVAELASLASKGVPGNVEREIRGWFNQCRRVAVRQATIIECPDAETAGRVRAAIGKQARLIGDSMVEIPGERPTPEVYRKLAKAGIFVE